MVDRGADQNAFYTECKLFSLLFIKFAMTTFIV